MIAKRQERSQEGLKDREDLLSEVAVWRERAMEAEERAKLVESGEQARANERI